MQMSETSLTEDRASRIDALARHPWRLAAGVAIVAVALFIPVLTSGTFVTDDDSVLRVSLVSHVRNVPAIFGRDFMIHTDGVYRPLPCALLATVRTVVPPDAVTFWRLWMLAFHVVAALLVWRLAREFTARTLPPLAALAVFLCHPLASSVAGQINLFGLTLGVVLYLGCLLAYVRFARTRRRRFYALALALFALGLFTSRVILSLPVLLVCLDLFGWRTHPLRALLRLAPFALLIVGPAYLWLTLRPHPIFYAYPQKA
ncbi:MAG TPA: hypothetical protein VMX57_03445, partial [Planctomycetota bacterium]|nr:hypothetical protein [Planctomycetota bacterium]